MLFTQTIKSQNVAKPHSSGEETLWHNRRTCPDGGLHCGIGSHCLTDSCRKNEEEEEEEEEEMSVPKDMWSIPWRSTKETRLRALQFKILHNIYPAKLLLEKMGIAPDSLCQICKVQDFTEHFFAECTSVKPMWKEIEKYLAIYMGRFIKLSPSSILLGFDNSIASGNEQKKNINHAILIGKMCISKFKYGKPTHLISLFQTECETRQLKMFSQQ